MLDALLEKLKLNNLKINKIYSVDKPFASANPVSFHHFQNQLLCFEWESTPLLDSLTKINSILSTKSTTQELLEDRIRNLPDDVHSLLINRVLSRLILIDKTLIDGIPELNYE